MVNWERDQRYFFETSQTMTERLFGMMTRTLAMLFAIAILPFAAHSSSAPLKQVSLSGNAAEWQRYTVDDEDFSVLLPVMPAMATSSMYIDRTRTRRERIIAAYESGVVYSVFTYEKKSLSLQDLIRQRTNYDAASPGTAVTV